MEKIRLGIVDDNKDLCDILKRSFEASEDIEVSFIAEDGLTAIKQVREQDVSRRLHCSTVCNGRDLG